MSEPAPESFAALARELAAARAAQAATAEILAAMHATPGDPQVVFQAVADHARVLAGAVGAVATRLDGEMLHLVAWSAARGYKRRARKTFANFPRPLDESALNARAILHRAPAHIPDLAKAKGLDRQLKQAVLEGGARSLLAIPILHREKALGSLMVVRTEPGPFDDELVGVLQGFAGQAAMALANAHLIRETREALEREVATAEVLEVISSSPTDVQPVYDAIAERAALLTRARVSWVVRVEHAQLALVAVSGLTDAHATRAREVFPAPLDRSTVGGRAVLGGRAEQVADLIEDTEIGEIYQRFARAGGLRSALAVPLLREGQAIGAILVSRGDPTVFPDEHVALLETFAAQAVIAIENVRMFRETNEALRRQTATAEVLSVISQSVDNTTPVYEKIIDSCRQLFDTGQVSIFLVNGEAIEMVAVRGVVDQNVAALFPRPLDDSVNGLSVRTRQVVNFSSAAAVARRPGDMQQVYELVGDHSVMVAPMLWEGRAIGTILVSRVPPRAFADDEVALLITFADQAVIAIQNSRLFHEIEDKSRQLEAANQHKSEFLANMSHELRTPLNAVIGFSEVLIERMFGDLNEKQEDYLKDIHASGKHLLSLINDILDLSKIEAGRMELDVEEFDLRSALENTLTLIRERAERHGIGLTLDAADNLDGFRADQRKFKQIMLNLLSNAVKFTPDGGRITVRARLAEPDLLEVAVADTGIGIAPEFLETIFEEFRQAGGSYTNKQEGTGLGLSLTRRIVELHGGTIGVASEPGAGATFTFTLPRQP